MPEVSERYEHMTGLLGGVLVYVHGQQAERAWLWWQSPEPVPPTTWLRSAALSLRTVCLLSVSFLLLSFFLIARYSRSACAARGRDVYAT